MDLEFIGKNRLWAQKLNNDLQKLNTLSNWHYETYSGTMLNGCGGWVGSHIFYNNVVVIGRIYGWVNFPANSWKNINFSTNPLISRVDFSNLTIAQNVMVFPDSSDARVPMLCNLSENNTQLGLWTTLNNDTTQVRDPSAHILFSMPFTSPVGVLK